MKKIFLLIGLLFAIGLFAQEKGLIRGIILDQEMVNEPLMFATLELKGTSLTTQSNLFGKVEMVDVEPGIYILAISQSGYMTIEIPIKVKANEVTEIQQILGAEKLSLEELIMVSENSTEVDKLSSSLTKIKRE